MARGKGEIHFSRNMGYGPILRLRRDADRRYKADMIRKMTDDYEEDDLYDDITEGIEGLRALNKKKALKALANGKVMNTKRRKFRKWKKHDKHLIKDLLSEHLQTLYESGDISYRRAKRIRKEATSRILHCFYGKAE